MERPLHIVRLAWRTHRAQWWLAKATRADSRTARDLGVLATPGVVGALHRVARRLPAHAREVMAGGART
eukprot:7834270-Alexandrium_andersonii.AAC.1